MISPKDMQLLAGIVFCIVMQAIWEVKKELAVLPDKIASYLYEFHTNSYAFHSLPPFPVDRNNTYVHEILKPHQVFF